jgi:hypothetical protein
MSRTHSGNAVHSTLRRSDPNRHRWLRHLARLGRYSGLNEQRAVADLAQQIGKDFAQTTERDEADI